MLIFKAVSTKDIILFNIPKKSIPNFSSNQSLAWAMVELMLELAKVELLTLKDSALAGTAGRSNIPTRSMAQTAFCICKYYTTIPFR
jgi:hypothetical protein